MAHPSVDQLGIGLAQPAIKERKNYGVDGPAGYMQLCMAQPAICLAQPARCMAQPAIWWVAQPAIYLAQPAIWWVAHEILVSAQAPWFWVLGLRDFGTWA